MKFEQAVRSVEGSAPISKGNITIAANSKAFALLFKTIYPNIIKAITRELITNAWDSHKEKGNLDIPFEVHCPTALEPFFSVRDYGVSMTTEQVDKIYSTIFESSKDQTDDLAGMYGMGSKTPLGYVDTFSLQCWKNGRTRIYDIFLNANGAPEISLQFDDVSDEDDGVLVTLFVKEKDLTEFRDHTMKMLAGFDTVVKVDGEKYQKTRAPIFKEGDGWKLYAIDAYDRSYRDGLMIRMGCITYPLRDNLFKSPTGKKYEYIGHMLRTPAVLEFPIGTFNVTGSREDIIYTEEGNKLIADKLLEIVDMVKEEVTKELGEIRNLTKRAYRTQFMTSMWQHYFPHIRNVMLTEVDAAVRKGPKSLRVKKGMIIKDASPIVNSYSFDRRSRFFDNIYVNKRRIAPYIFVAQPDSKNVRQRIFEFAQSHKAETVALQKEYGNNTCYPYVETTESTDSLMFAKMKVWFGEPRIVDLDKELPFVKPARKAPVKIVDLELTPTSRIGLYRHNYTKKPDKEIVDLKNTVYYVTTHYQDYTDHFENEDILHFLATNYPKIDWAKTKVYACSKATEAWMKAKWPTADFQNIFVIIREWVEKNELDLNEEEATVQYLDYNVSRSEILRNNEKICKMLNIPFTKNTKQYTLTANGVAVDQRLVRLLSQKKSYLEKRAKFQESLLVKIQEFWKKYPLLAYIDTYAARKHSDVQTNVDNYIDAIDKL